MAIDAHVAPPLPPEIPGRPVTRIDGTATSCVTPDEAARLMGVSRVNVDLWIKTGKVDVCKDGRETYVLVDSLWLLVPEEERRG